MDTTKILLYIAKPSSEDSIPGPQPSTAMLSPLRCSLSLLITIFIILQMQGVSVLFLAVSVCGLVGVTAGGKCDVLAPDKTLSELHSPCDTSDHSRGSDCVAAMNRFCEQATYPAAIETLGVSREQKPNVIGMSCVRSKQNQVVRIDTLQKYHPECNTIEKSQHRDCLSAIHRFCMDKFGNSFAGMSLEIPSTESLKVACFYSPKKTNVPFRDLAALHDGCEFPNSDSSACFAATSRWCYHAGYDGGITQEVNGAGAFIACYNAEFTGDAFISPGSAEYKRAKSTIARICSLDFELDKGSAVPFPNYLKIETYDNRASSVELNSDFGITKEVSETSSFTSTTSLTIGAEISLSLELPIFSEGGITLSTSVTNEVSMTKETTKTTSYTTTSPVSVPAGKAIVKEAIVFMANLDVPYIAVGLNGLGSKAVIRGQWKGVSSYDFEIKQKDMVKGGCPCAPQ